MSLNNDITEDNEKKQSIKSRQKIPFNQYTVTTQRGEQDIMEYNNLLNAEIILPNGDDTQQIINIIDRKQVLYGKFIGR